MLHVTLDFEESKDVSFHSLTVDLGGFAEPRKSSSLSCVAWFIGCRFRSSTHMHTTMVTIKIENGLDDADDIEALATLKGTLQLICHIGMRDIILWRDSMWAVDVLKSYIPNLSRQGTLFEEIKILLNHFNIFEVHHVGSDGNAVAHKLARHVQ